MKKISYPSLGSLILLIFSIDTRSYSFEKTFDKKNTRAVDLAEKGNYEAALRIFQGSLKGDKLRAITYHNIGYTFQLQKKYKEAKKYYRKSIVRDPKLAPPRAKLGKLLYNEKNYQEAIVQGEKGLAIDPKERSIKEWLPDAYKKYTEGRLIKINQKDLTKGRSTEDISGAYDPFAALRRLGWRSFKFEYIVHNILSVPKGGGVNYESLPIGFRIPMTLDIEIRSLLMGVHINFQSPYYTGSFNPQFIERETTLELLYPFKRLSFGLGLKFSEANFVDQSLPPGLENFFTNGLTPENERVKDYKIGLKFVNDAKFFHLDITVYPRYLFRDKTSNREGLVSFDRNFASLKTKFKPTPRAAFWNPRFLFQMIIDEWYITEYGVDNSVTGHYFGYYDLILGVVMGNFENRYKKTPIEVGFILINRLFFRDLADTDPFAFGNGQGFFGYSSEDTSLDNSIPGFLFTSHSFEAYIKTRFFNFLVLGLSLNFEFAPDNRSDFHFAHLRLTVSTHY